MSSQVPASTYRLQLHKGFGFREASAVAKYLSDLGVTHIYCSPYLQAQDGSLHGYDVIDHQRVNEDLGGKEAHERFSRELAELGLSQILDIVPNHVGVSSHNRLWWDVLENGVSSRYASFFDIDWQPHEERLRDKVVLPILPDQYGRVLESGGIKVLNSGCDFFVEVSGDRFPVSPTSLPQILSAAALYSNSNTLSFIAASFARLPNPPSEDRRTVLARHRDKTVITDLLERVCSEENAVVDSIERATRELNEDHNALDNFLNLQNYRLAYWKTADQQLGYRRFFDVNSLIGLRMEREHVFEETHALIFAWLHEGIIDGVRIDHLDGLRDPAEYLCRIREAAANAWLVGEKILSSGEFLRSDKHGTWPIDGTSGYDFLNTTIRLLVRPEGMDELTKIYEEFTGQPNSFKQIAHSKRVLVGQEALGSDVNRLTSLFVGICEARRNQRDYTRADIRRVIREIAACFPVYRTYVIPERGEITPADREYINSAVRLAKSYRPDIDAGLFDFFEEVLTLRSVGVDETEFVLRFQQFTPPIFAKGVEDTAFYCYNRLVALCEVGGDPTSNGSRLEDFHAYHQGMLDSSPNTMTCLSTHDTKRADDVRARLAVLSEMPHQFADSIAAWSQNNVQYRTTSKEGRIPDPNTEYFLYQTLIGAWPIDIERVTSYMVKSMREAKEHTSWTAPNMQYENGVCQFIASIFGDGKFLEALEGFVARVIMPGRINSLTQTLLKNVCPGIPDHYQGSELWDLSLVDPDNRRPVDFVLRAKLLSDLQTANTRDVLAQMDLGVPKLHVINQTLLLRRRHPEWFGADADYRALYARGAKHRHVVAFARGRNVIAIGVRHPHCLGGQWGDTTITVPHGVWGNIFTGEQLKVGTDELVSVDCLLRDFPVALLYREASNDE